MNEENGKGKNETRTKIRFKNRSHTLRFWTLERNGPQTCAELSGPPGKGGHSYVLKYLLQGQSLGSFYQTLHYLVYIQYSLTLFSLSKPIINEEKIRQGTAIARRHE